MVEMFTKLWYNESKKGGVIRCQKVKMNQQDLKNHLYYSMKRMRHQIDVEYRDYFEEEPEEGKFDI